ncbi:hypothetical protein Tco_0732929 [Tanacetum coccineum]
MIFRDIVAYAGFSVSAYTEEQILLEERVIPVPLSIDLIVASCCDLQGIDSLDEHNFGSSMPQWLSEILDIFFASADQSMRAFSELKDGVEVRGKLVKISKIQNNKTLFLGNISKTWSKEEVSECGSLLTTLFNI